MLISTGGAATRPTKARAQAVAARLGGRQQGWIQHIGAEPNAVGFYRAMGAEHIAETPSASIPGRSLPLMLFQLGHVKNHDGGTTS